MISYMLVASHSIKELEDITSKYLYLQKNEYEVIDKKTILNRHDLRRRYF